MENSLFPNRSHIRVKWPSKSEGDDDEVVPLTPVDRRSDFSFVPMRKEALGGFP